MVSLKISFLILFISIILAIPVAFISAILSLYLVEKVAISFFGGMPWYYPTARDVLEFFVSKIRYRYLEIPKVLGALRRSISIAAGIILYPFQLSGQYIGEHKGVVLWIILGLTLPLTFLYFQIILDKNFQDAETIQERIGRAKPPDLLWGFGHLYGETIQERIDRAKPGEVISIGEGNYKVSLKVSGDKKNIKLVGKGSDKTILWNDSIVLTVEDGNKVEASKITFKSAGDPGVKPAILLNHSAFILTDGRITGHYSRGIDGSNSAVQIKFCTIEGDGRFGIYLSYDEDLSPVNIEGNIFANYSKDAIYLRVPGKDPFVLRNNELIQGNILIRDNIFRGRNLPTTLPLPNVMQTE